MISRRGLFRAAGGAGLALAAPAIIRTAGLLMPIKPLYVGKGLPSGLIAVGPNKVVRILFNGQSNWVSYSEQFIPQEQGAALMRTFFNGRLIDLDSLIEAEE